MVLCYMVLLMHDAPKNFGNIFVPAAFVADVLHMNIGCSTECISEVCACNKM